MRSSIVEASSRNSTTNNTNNNNLEGWDRYRKVRELGQGAYGTVYLCIDTSIPEPSLQQETDPNLQLDYYVAIKCVSLAGATETESSNALREVAILRNLDHPNVLRMLDCFIDKHEHLCTVTEFIDGGDLSDMIEKCNSMYNNNKNSSDNHNTSTQQRSSKNKSSNTNSSTLGANNNRNGGDNFSYRVDDRNSNPSYNNNKNQDGNQPSRFYVDAIAIVDIAEQILKGLSYIHASRILHHDLKPANIFITSTGCIKIGDFGVARIINNSQQHSRSYSASSSSASLPANNTNSVNRTLLGTPFYLSPEGLLGSRTSFPADIWSFGVLLYELYCGVVPFNARNVLALVNIITQGQYDQDRLAARPYRSGLNENNLSATANAGGISAQVQQEVCDAVSSIIKAALVLDPAERPSARQLLLKFFTEDASAPTNPEVMLFSDPSVIPPSSRNQQHQQQRPNSGRSNGNGSVDSTLRTGSDENEGSTFYYDENTMNSRLAQQEVLSVVRSVSARNISENGASTNTTTSGLQEQRSLLVAATEILDVTEDEARQEQLQQQRYEDDFEDDILSSTVMKRNAKDKTKEFLGSGGSNQSNNPDDDSSSNFSLKDVMPPSQRNRPNNNLRGDDTFSLLDGTAAIEHKVNALPWVVEAQVFEGIKLDNVSGHGPLYIVKDHYNHHHHQNQHQNQQQLSIDPKEHFIEQQQHRPRPTSAATNNTSSSSASTSPSSKNRLGFLQQHRGQHSDLVCELVTPSKLKMLSLHGNNNNDNDIENIFSLSATMTTINNNSKSENLSLTSFVNNGNGPQPQQEPTSSSARKSHEEYYQDMQKRIRERAVIFHKKRLNALAKEREHSRVLLIQEQQQRQITSEDSGMIDFTLSSPHHLQQPGGNKSAADFSVPINVPPLGGFAKPLALDPTAIVSSAKQAGGGTVNRSDQNQNQIQQQPVLMTARRASHLLNEIVDSRARGIVSGALMSAFPHLLPRPQSEYQQPRSSVSRTNPTTTTGTKDHETATNSSPKPTGKLTTATQRRIERRGGPQQQQQSSPDSASRKSGSTAEYDESSDSISEDDEEEDDISTDDEEEEEEEEQSEIDEDEFRIKVVFSHETATLLKAVPYDPQTFNVNASLPRFFPSFTIKFHLFSDDGYSKLLKAIQDRVIFFAEAEKLLAAVSSNGTGNDNNDDKDKDDGDAMKTIAGSLTKKSTTTSASTKEDKKSRSRTNIKEKKGMERLLLDATSHLAKSATTTALSQCVPLSFEYVVDEDGKQQQQSDKIVFNRRADWSCVREMHLDSKGMDVVMNLTAIPRE